MYLSFGVRLIAFVVLLNLTGSCLYAIIAYLVLD